MSAVAVDAGPNSMFASLRVRNFRLFYGGQFISQVGNWLTMVGQTLLVFKMTGNGVAVGGLVACQFAPVLFFGAWAGLVADRSDKRRLLLTIQSLAMVQSFVLSALAFMDRPPLAALYAIALAGGFATAFDSPARRSFVVEMVPQGLVNNAVSLNSAMMTSARIFGPALAGLLVTTVGYGWCFLIDGASYVAVLAALGAMRTTELRAAPPAKRSKGQVREGLRYVVSVPELWIPLVMMTLIGTLAFNFQVVLPLFAVRSLHGDEQTFTLLFSVLSAGSFVGALATARRQRVTLAMVVGGALAFGVSMTVLALSPNLWRAYPVAAVLGASSIAFMTSSTALVQTEAGADMRGRVLALQSMVFLGSTPIGGPLLGAVCEQFGARAGVLVGGGGALAAAAFGKWAVTNRVERRSLAPFAAATERS
ncbi:MAG: MFS transporter [Acidimicrobiales bacterium]|nr:MFS transporter [Acidimicrobiales bacterium]